MNTSRWLRWSLAFAIMIGFVHIPLLAWAQTTWEKTLAAAKKDQSKSWMKRSPYLEAARLHGGRKAL